MSLSRRRLLQAPALGLLGAALPALAFAQGDCRDGYGTADCPLPRVTATAPVSPPFPTTGWRTVGLDHISFQVPDYRKEAAFYVALMGWTLRSDDGTRAVLDIGRWGSAVFRSAPERKRAVVDGFCFVVAPWDARKVEAALRRRGLDPIRDDNGHGFESFHVKDPDGWDLQISNGRGLAAARRTAPAVIPTAAPFAPTGWRTVWLDHLSFHAANYKQTAAFYQALLGWTPTYDEGSQVELRIGDIGDIIVRGGNPYAADFTLTPNGRPRHATLDHISFGVRPWGDDTVRAALEARGLKARMDTSTKDDIHVAAYRSYHTETPNGFNLQISFVGPENRLALSEAVRPRP